MGKPSMLKIARIHATRRSTQQDAGSSLVLLAAVNAFGTKLKASNVEP